MNVSEQLNKFVRTALQNNNTVTLEGQEISDITCESIEHISSSKRIRFTVTFMDPDIPWPFPLKNGEHLYYLDIDMKSIEITDDRFHMRTIPLPDQKHRKHRTIRIRYPDDIDCNHIYGFSFFIKQKEPPVPTITIDVNDL